MNTTYFMNQVMGNVFGTKKTPALPTAYYIGLSSSEPNINGSGVTEPTSSAGYARVKLDALGEPSNGIITNAHPVSFEESTAGWGTMTNFVIYDAATGGNLLMFDKLSENRSVESGTILTIKAGSLTITLSNVA